MEKKDYKAKFKAFLNKIFIDGFSGMALGLFCTLIIGTIVAQVGSYIPGTVGTLIVLVGKMAQCLMGAREPHPVERVRRRPRGPGLLRTGVSQRRRQPGA